MEFSEANFPRMKVHGYEMKHELSYGVKGADPVALRILERRWKTTVHYCTSGYKDGWQLRSRIKRRAENVARPWDVVTEDGTLVKGILEGSDLERLMRDLEVRHRVPKDLMGLDDARNRLEVAPWILQEIAPILGRPALLVRNIPPRTAPRWSELGPQKPAPRPPDVGTLQTSKAFRTARITHTQAILVGSPTLHRN